MIFELHRVAAGYGPVRAIVDIDLIVRPGELVVLLGRNGAGKSTTLKCAMGLLPVDAGDVRVDGVTVNAMATHERARLGLGYVPEDRRLFGGLTVTENLEVARRAPRTGQAPWSIERAYALFPALRELRDRPAARLSGGEQQMLTIARSLMGNPRALLLDEPTEGLAPRIVRQIATTLRTLKDEGMGVLLSEQNVHFAQAVADRAYLIESGHLRFAGAMSEVRDNAALRERYLSV